MSLIDIQFWAIRKREGRRRPYELRWRIGAHPYSRSFKTKQLAQNHQARLLAAAKEVGTEWDLKTGEPVSWNQKRESWYDHSRAYMESMWANYAGHTRRGTSDVLTAIMIAMIADSPRARRTRPDDVVLRRALKQWAYRLGRLEAEQAPAEIVSALDWVAEHSRPVADLDDDAAIRGVLASLGTLFNGKPTAPGGMRKRRATFYSALDLAVERKLLKMNLLATIKTKRQHSDDAVSPVVVPTLQQAQRTIEAIKTLPFYSHNTHRAGMLYAFFSVIMYAGLRPSEVQALLVDNCHLPATGWGKLTLTGAIPDVGANWTDDGDRHERRGLKHRSKNAVRIVPIPPTLVAILRQHLIDFAPAADGRLFYDGPSEKPLRAPMYREVWGRARKAALSDAEQASQVARRPYDLRHFNASTLILAGVDVAQIARRLGHSIQTLLTTYAHWIDTGEDEANAMIEAVLAAQASKPVTSENTSHGPSTGQPAETTPVAA
ncbi:tyrosine-type recombinase/integrase [Nonomuraea endophytica]|uniref:tyrosine-type recombinase/integrase n=1 Tax=Nonomuraea endophytica TaxID=714136 RepID=UPI0037CC76A0